MLNEKRHCNLERAACCRPNAGGDGRDRTLLHSASPESGYDTSSRLSIRGRTFVALLGPAIEEGIAGFGDTVQAALRAFDAQYSSALTPLADRD
jgi:hypothetical protein